MTTKLSTSIAALAAVIFAAPAYAADPLDRGGLKDPTSAEYIASERVKSWSGVWIGAVGGYQFGNSELNYDEACFRDGERVAGSSATIDGLGSDGFFGELQIGLDKQIGQRVVVGVFGGVNINDAEFNIDASQFNPSGSESANILSFQQEWGGVLGARAGVLTTPNTLLYIAGGWAFGEMGQVKSDFGGSDGNGGNVFENQETDLNGYFAELGMETRVTENVYFTLAGRYTDYGAITLDSVSSEGSSESLELDHDTLTVMAGLKIKLGGGSLLGFGE